MLMPKRVKYRREHRGRMKGRDLRGNTVTYGEYGLQATQPAWITSNQIEAARIAMTRFIKRGGHVWIKIFPHKPVTEKPADDWLKEGFDDSKWKTGLAPFASGGEKRTDWQTPEIYFRQTFEYDGGNLKNGAVVIRHNDNTEVYINGQKVLAVRGSGGYSLEIVTEEMKKALKKGTNTIAVHSHEGGKGQWVDLAILVD